MIKKIFIIILFLFFTNILYAADTLLVGFDSTSYSNGCWIDNATSIDSFKWKSQRMRAVASGTIAYFKIRIAYTPTGCTNDSGCWAIYEDLGSDDPIGALKAYGCFTGYNWTTKGIGDHTFNVTNTGTNLTITSGNYYTFVIWSHAIDDSEYATANCSSPILKYRGRSGDCAAGVSGFMTFNADSFSNIPPNPRDFDYEALSYFMWGIWSSDTDNPPVPPTNLRVEE